MSLSVKDMNRLVGINPALQVTVRLGDREYPITAVQFVETIVTQAHRGLDSTRVVIIAQQEEKHDDSRD